MKQCIKCGRELKDNDKFCDTCGASQISELNKFCIHCGRPVSADSNLCPSCGKPHSSLPKQFCIYCGKELKGNDNFCDACGRQQSNMSLNQSTAATDENPSTASMALIFSFVIPIIGLILGIVGLTSYKTAEYKNRCLAAIVFSLIFPGLIAGIILAAAGH